jgi:ligand-binding sensor domain-containing protein/signal transduction histidine kinase
MSTPRTCVYVLLVLVGLRFIDLRAAEPSDFLMDFWTSDENLPNASVTAITQTPDGYLWIGTYNGLARFDGVRFVNFDPLNTPALKHARIHAQGLFCTTNGTLWINTYDGSMTALRNGVFTHEWKGGNVTAVFTQSNLTYFALQRDGLVCRNERAGADTNWLTVKLPGPALGTFFRQDAAGAIWVATRDGLIGRVNGTNCEIIQPEKSGLTSHTAKCLTADHLGQIWVATDQEIARWDGRQFVNLTPTNGSPALNATFLFCGESNVCWVVSDGQMRECRDRRWTGDTTGWRDLATANHAFMSTHWDHAGRTWLRSFSDGLFYTASDGTLRRMTADQGLPNSRVSCWFEDREGNIWLGVDRGGLVRLRERRFQVIGAAQGISVPAISSVCEDQSENIWFGTFGGGLYRWAGGRLDHFALPGNTRAKSFFSLAPAADNRLWASAGNEDLYQLADGVFLPAKGEHGIKAMLVDREGGVWTGRQNGLSRLSGTNLVNFSARGDLERIDVRALAEDRQGCIWAGTGNGRIYRFENGKFTMFQATDNLKDQAVWSLLPDDDGTLWVGTFRGGLLRFKDGAFTRYTTKDGLPSDVISQILDDGLGRLWIGSHQGLFQIEKAALARFDQHQIPAIPCLAYGLFDGLPTLEFSDGYQPACWKGHDGRLWFATVKGLVNVDPRKVRINRQPPPVVVEDIFVDGKSRDVRQAITLSPGRHQLEFQFTALSFAAPDKVRFRHKLRGIDQDWTKATALRSTTYGPLPPGEYQFQVIACNNDGIWNTTGASLAVIQLPFFWQTWWFMPLAIFSGILIIAATTSYAISRRMRRKLERIKHQHAIELERERIAKDIHDDLGAGLTQIMFQSSLAKNAPVERMQTDLSQISETARDLVRTMDEIVWAINPENDTLEGLTTYLCKYVQEFLTAAKLRCRLDLPAELPAIAVPADARHHVYLAVKETLNNLVKHARATEVLFQFQLRAGAFAFVIKDNGIGLTGEKTEPDGGLPSRISSGHGLRHLAHRLESLGGSCHVSSEPARGTCIELIIPCKI